MADSRGILFEVGDAPGAGNGNDVRVPDEQPGEGDLGVAQAARGGEGGELFDEPPVGVFGRALETRIGLAEIVFREFFRVAPRRRAAAPSGGSRSW